MVKVCWVFCALAVMGLGLTPLIEGAGAFAVVFTGTLLAPEASDNIARVKRVKRTTRIFFIVHPKNRSYLMPAPLFSGLFWS
jgi:hypothetical protein